MRIYTRTGDGGDTGLFGGGRVPKDHIRVDAYGAVDELNSVLGLAAARLDPAPTADLAREVLRMQSDLLSVGAILATPTAAEGGRAASRVPELPGGRTGELEALIDALDGELEPLRAFILPGGSEAAASLHLARTVCRRAERRVVTLARETAIPGAVVVYLNRLSDALFTMARAANHRLHVPDIPWTPDLP